MLQWHTMKPHTQATDCDHSDAQEVGYFIDCPIHGPRRWFNISYCVHCGCVTLADPCDCADAHAELLEALQHFGRILSALLEEARITARP